MILFERCREEWVVQYYEYASSVPWVPLGQSELIINYSKRFAKQDLIRHVDDYASYTLVAF
jgi:hypothetical protein